MSKAEDYLEDARTAFQLAGDSFDADAIQDYTEMGREYLRRSREAAEISEAEVKPASRWIWGF